MTTQPLALIHSTSGQVLLAQMYGQQQLEEQTARYTQLNGSFEQYFGVQEGSKLFSAAGRSEIGGNHMDHNHGKVLEGSITLDTIAVAAPTTDSVVEGQEHVPIAD